MPRGYAFKCDYCGQIDFAPVPHYSQDRDLPQGWTFLVTAQVDNRDHYLYLCSATCIIGALPERAKA